MSVTPNFSWPLIEPTDFVTNLPADFETFADAVDDTVKDLNPGTTAGDLDYYTSSTAKARLGIGTAGQVLKVNSGATAPEWGSVTSDSYTQLATGSIPGSVTEFSITSINSGYRKLVLVLDDVKVDAANLALRFNSDTGNNYAFAGNNNTGFTQIQNTQPYARIAGINSADDTKVVIEIPEYASTTSFKTFFSQFFGYNSSAAVYFSGMYAGGWQNAAAISTITVYNGNLNNFTAQGNYYLYGVK